MTGVPAVVVADVQEGLPAPLPVPREHGLTELQLLDAYSGDVRRLRVAASEALLAGALLVSDVKRENYTGSIKASEERFLKALEALREALQ